CPGLHAFARCAGLRGSELAVPGPRGLALGYMLSPAARAWEALSLLTQGCADLPWATCFRPLRGLARPELAAPGLRGLALGYMLSPAARACAALSLLSQGCADLPWATCFRPLRGLAELSVARYASSIDANFATETSLC